MNLMVAADDNWAIGNKNELLITIPADHRLFRQETEGKVVVYGRKTLSTFPQKMPLPGRVNVILSSSRDFQVKGAKVAHDLEELFEELRKYPREQIYVIGGESVYRQLLPYCRVAHVTKSTAVIRRTPFSRIWMRSPDGGLRRTARSRPILM